MSERIAPYPVRMPDDLRSELEGVAKRNKRSLNAEIVARLEQTLGRTSEPDDLSTDIPDWGRELHRRLDQIEKLIKSRQA